MAAGLVRLVKGVPPWHAIRGAICLLLLGFIIGALIHVNRHVTSRPQFLLRADSIKLESLPPWCPPPLVRHLNEMGARFRGCSIYEANLAERVVKHYLADPWVRSVIHVRKVFPNTLQVKLELRRPKYAIERPARCPLVDFECHVLPEQYVRRPGVPIPIPFVRGVSGDPPGPGMRWADSALLGAVEVLETIEAANSPVKQLPLIGADVSNFGGRIDRRKSDIVLLTGRPNVTILWGRPPSMQSCDEPTVQEKLAFIERWMRGRPMAGDPARPIALNVRFAQAGGGVIVADAPR